MWLLARRRVQTDEAGTLTNAILAWPATIPDEDAEVWRHDILHLCRFSPALFTACPRRGVLRVIDCGLDIYTCHQTSPKSRWLLRFPRPRTSPPVPAQRYPQLTMSRPGTRGAGPAGPEQTGSRRRRADIQAGAAAGRAVPGVLRGGGEEGGDDPLEHVVPWYMRRDYFLAGWMGPCMWRAAVGDNTTLRIISLGVSSSWLVPWLNSRSSSASRPLTSIAQVSTRLPSSTSARSSPSRRTSASSTRCCSLSYLRDGPGEWWP